jgi:hypothetical protein
MSGKVEAPHALVGRPPYDNTTHICDGVVCYKCNVFTTTSWWRLYMHLSHGCLSPEECLYLRGSFLEREARREERRVLSERQDM